MVAGANSASVTLQATGNSGAIPVLLQVQIDQAPILSIERLRAREWFPQRGEMLQCRLWQALEAVCTRQSHLPVEYRRLRSEPSAVLREVAAYAHLAPTASQLSVAEAFIERA